MANEMVVFVLGSVDCYPQKNGLKQYHYLWNHRFPIVAGYLVSPELVCGNTDE